MPKHRNRSAYVGENGKYSRRFGPRGNTVTLYEREPDGTLYVRCYDPTLADGKGGYRRECLGHRDIKRGEIRAQELSLKIAKGEEDLSAGRITLRQLFAVYERDHVPENKPHEQSVKRRQMELWIRVLGPNKNPHKITLREWRQFIRARRTGAIDARGRPVPEGKRRPLGDRVVGKDCAFLNHVVDWGVAEQISEDRYLMEYNPIRRRRRGSGNTFVIPKEANPRRPVASHDRYLAIRAISDQVTMEIRCNGKRERVRSYLSEILDVVNGTGRRANAVCSLRYEDLRLERTPLAPHGGIVWPAETDKKDSEWTAPLDAETREAIDRILRERPGIGRAPLFPTPADPTVPIRRDVADKWLLKAEELAKVRKQNGSLWHAYRRKWVTEREEHPLSAIAGAGGWSDTQTIEKCYLKTKPETILAVVTEPKRLRHALGD
jgi:integrase